MAELKLDRLVDRLGAEYIRVHEVELRGCCRHCRGGDCQRLCGCVECFHSNILISAGHTGESVSKQICRVKVVGRVVLSTIYVIDQPAIEPVGAGAPVVRTIDKRPHTESRLCCSGSLNIRADQITEIIPSVGIGIHLNPVSVCCKRNFRFNQRLCICLFKRPFFQTIPGRGGGICTMYLSKIQTLRISTGWTFRLRASSLFRLRCRG